MSTGCVDPRFRQATLPRPVWSQFLKQSNLAWVGLCKLNEACVTLAFAAPYPSKTVKRASCDCEPGRAMVISCCVQTGQRSAGAEAQGMSRFDTSDSPWSPGAPLKTVHFKDAPTVGVSGHSTLCSDQLNLLSRSSAQLRFPVARLEKLDVGAPPLEPRSMSVSISSSFLVVFARLRTAWKHTSNSRNQVVKISIA